MGTFGAIYPVIFLNGKPSIITGYFGLKRHLAVDINGLPMAVHATTANVSERDGANALLALNKSQFDLVHRVMADGGYMTSERSE